MSSNVPNITYLQQPPPSYAGQNPTLFTSQSGQVQYAIPNQQKQYSARLQRVRAAFKALSICQLVGSALILILGITSIATGKTVTWYLCEDDLYTWGSFCNDESSVWGGIIMLAASIFGLVFSLSKINEKCTLIGYFVMCIIASVFSTAPLSSSIILTLAASFPHHSCDFYFDDYVCTQVPRILGLNVTIASLSFIAGILFIVSAVLTCYLWGEVGCCQIYQRQPQPETVTYVAVPPSYVQSSSTLAAAPTQVVQEKV